MRGTVQSIGFTQTVPCLLVPCLLVPCLLRGGATDYHFITRYDSGWFNKIGAWDGHYVDIDFVTDPVWYSYKNDFGTPDERFYYSDEIIFVAIDKEWYL